MQTIDKSQAEVELLFTLTEFTTIENPFYLLVLQSSSTNKTYRFVLPENDSLWLERVDKFLIDNTDGLIFKDLEPSQYYYEVYQSAVSSENETVMGKSIDSGLVNVIDTEEVEEEFIAITNPEADDDFIIYE